MSADTVVIGAGVNGLVAAHLLARGGRRVTVLEQRATANGAPFMGWVPPQVIRELGLDRAGLSVRHGEPWVSSALPDGTRLELSSEIAKSQGAIKRLSAADAAKWPEFAQRMRRLSGVLEALYVRPPPDVESRDPKELMHLAMVALKVRRLGKQAVVDLIRILPMSSAELLDDWFESDALKGVLGAASVLHLHQGPKSGGTAFNLLHHHVGCPAGVFRQPSSNVRDVLERMPGVDVRRGAAVARLNVTGGRVTGVRLANGEEIAATTVVSSGDPRHTMLGLLEPGWLEPEYARAVKNIKCRGVAATVTLDLKGAAPFDSLLIAPSLMHLERAYDDAKYGRASKEPWLEANAEGNRILVHAQYAPYGLRDGGWDDARRAAFGNAVVARLLSAAPELKGAITVRDIVTPKDLEVTQGLTEGQAYHGELTLDQILFMRPVPGWPYRTPIAGLFLCGAGTHPGGAIAGASGRNAAREILRS